MNPSQPYGPMKRWATRDSFTMSHNGRVHQLGETPIGARAGSEHWIEARTSHWKGVCIHRYEALLVVDGRLFFFTVGLFLTRFWELRATLVASGDERHAHGAFMTA